MERIEFLKISGFVMVAVNINLKEMGRIIENMPFGEILPAVFVGHGSPMNAIEENLFTKSLTALGKSLPKPNAVLVVSAHWQTRGTQVSFSTKPETIYDFYGFPPELYKVKYPAPGAPEKARLVQEAVKSYSIGKDENMGLDHGAWSVLKHIYPAADIPVFQLSLDHHLSPQKHYELAKELASLRKKGILILGSGNIVHNLSKINLSGPDVKPYDWALEFDENVKKKIIEKEHSPLINYESMGKAALYSVPTNEHYLPMLYILAMQEKNENAQFTFEGFQYASASMRCFRVG